MRPSMPGKMGCLLQECMRRKDLAAGRQFGGMVLGGGCDLYVYVKNPLIALFPTCGSLMGTNRLFGSLAASDMYSWNAIISAHVHAGRNQQAINLYRKMVCSPVVPNEYVFVVILKACANVAALAEGRLVHEHIKEYGLESSILVGNALVAMYAKCGNMHEASKTFCNLREKDVVSWTCMIGGHVRHGYISEALHLFEKMEREGVKANRITYMNMIKGCAAISALEHGKRIHAELINKGLGSDLVIGNMLVDMYSKCGRLDEAKDVFNSLRNRDVVSWTAIIAGHSVDGDGQAAIQLLSQMEQQGVKANRITYLSVLKACSNGGPRDLDLGKQIHAHLVQLGLESDDLIQNTLINMFVKCSSMAEARKVFERSAKEEIWAWNALIAGYTQHGQAQEALNLFQQMKDKCLKPDKVTYLGIFRACGNIGAVDLGRRIHAEVRRRAMMQDVVIANALVSMYLKCQSLKEAYDVFEGLSVRDAATWTTMIRGHLQYKSGQEALELFQRMQADGVQPNKYTFVSVLGACGNERLIQEGRNVHVQLIRAGLGSDLAVGNALVHMYAKCGSLEDARSMFKSLPRKDVVSWTALICGCLQDAQGQEAVLLFQQMQDDGMKPDKVTFVSILRACCSTAALDLGRHIHALLFNSALEEDEMVMCILVQMYTKCGDLGAARKVFESLQEKSLSAFNTLIAGYVQHGHGQLALQLYALLEEYELQPDRNTFVVVLNACSSISALYHGRNIHALVKTGGLDSDPNVRNALLDMYTKCGSLNEAWDLFETLNKDVVSYNALIGGYAHHGHGQEAFKLYQRMQREGIEPNKITYVRLLKGCCDVECSDQGKQIHLELRKAGLEIDTALGNALLDMYCKCHCLPEALEVFRSVQERNAVTWAIMAACYIKHGHNDKAFQVFAQMLQEGKQPDSNAYVSFLRACASLAALELGEKIHSQVVSDRLESDAAVANALIDMYAKCGRLDAAVEVFKESRKKNVVTWTAMIGGYALHGKAQEALELFQQMLQADQRPNAVTFVSVLSACSHSGLVNDGRTLFKSMVEDYDIIPGVEHCGCMVDLLSRAGHLQEAVDVIHAMPVQPDDRMWLAVLGACQTHGEVELGRRVFNSIVELRLQTAAVYDLMCNIYAAAGRWEDEAQVREMSRLAGLKKVPGRTWIEVGNQVQIFTPSIPKTKGRKSAGDHLNGKRKPLNLTKL